MTGLDQFLDLFGNITVLNLVQFILAVVFIVIIFKKIKDYLDDKQERMIQEYEKIRSVTGSFKLHWMLSTSTPSTGSRA